MKICFLVRSLYVGGMERQLAVLSKGLFQRGHDVVIVVFYSGGELEKELEEAGVRIRSLHKWGRWDIFRFLFRLTHFLRKERPDILHSYLFDPNLVTVILKPFFPTIKVVWGIASSYMDSNHFDWLNRFSSELDRWLSRFPDAIISNSQAGRTYHLSLGYPAEKIIVIRNGIDTEWFRPDPEARGRIRSEWGITEHEKIIGLVGRLDPMKDHPIFLEAAAVLAKKRTDARFVCVGGGPDEYRTRLQTLAKRLGLEERLQWVEHCKDMPGVYNALDIAVSSSYGEGLSNVIGEAMACGVPCVVTNVGDSAWVVGDLGEVVPPKNPVALANAMQRLLKQNSYEPTRIRQRIVDQLSVGTLVTKTEHAINMLLTRV